jgi:tetratricopeptide (TPR) repeat protein
MKVSLLRFAALAVVLSCQPQTVLADSAEQVFANGEKLLAKADFDGALSAFAQAAKADRSKPEYLQHYAMVNQVVALRKRLATEQDAAQWEYVARGLHAFYMGQGLYTEALPLDRQIHERLNTAYSAALLAETQLVLNRPAEAAEVLAALPATKQTPGTRALHGLALARQDKPEAAREIAQQIALGPDSGPGMIYSVARLQAALGNTDAALGLLKRCFEGVAPSQLDGFKNHAKRSPEFSQLASTAAFVQVLETKSKVAESPCSGGTRCSNCPMRGQCPSSQKP